MNRNILRRLKVAVVASLMLISLIGCGANKVPTKQDLDSQEQQLEDTKETKSLFVYAGAGLKKPMEKIAKVYGEENNVKIEYSYAGSAQLISQIELAQKGDVFIIGSTVVYDKAKEKAFVGDYKEVAHHTPAIAVPKNNPKNIKKLEDLANDGVKVILGDEEANAIGKSAQKIIKKNNLEAINNNVVSKTSTVNEIIVQLSSGQADAAIVTADSVYKNDDLLMIPIDESKNVDQIIPVGVVEFSENKDEAQKFVDFVSSDEGKAIFDEFGFKAV